MHKDEIVSELNDLLGSYLQVRGLDLIDFNYRYEGRSLFLRIIVDRSNGGITLDECASLNADIGRVLDEKDVIQQRYVLEISSPGLDRPLKTGKDFLRCLGRKARFFLNEPIAGKWEWEGKIMKAEEDSVYVETEDGITSIPLSKISKAKQTIDTI